MEDNSVVAEAVRIAERARKTAITRELVDLINDLYNHSAKVAQIIEARHAVQKVYIVVLRHGDAMLISSFVRHKDGCFVSMDLDTIMEVEQTVIVSLDAIVLPPVQELPTIEIDAPQIVNLDGMPMPYTSAYLDAFASFWRWLSRRGI